MVVRELVGRRGARLAACGAAAVIAIGVAACGSGSSGGSGGTGGSTGGGTANAPVSSSTTASTGTSSGSGSVSLSSCGTKPGVKATGTPISVGAIATKQPGTDFSDGPNMVAAVFACVNANGGIDGHPLVLHTAFDQTLPAQIAADAKRLIDSDHVVAMVGSFDLLECTIDEPLFKRLGMYEIDAGISPECWSTPNSTPVNMGPRYSSDGAVQYAISQEHVDKIAFDQSNVPGTGYIAAGPKAIADAEHVPITEVTTNVPISNANSVAIQLVDDAGPNGAVILNFTPPEALVILQAAQKLGLEDRVKEWGASSPADTDFLSKALGPRWEHKLFVDGEVQSPDDHNDPEMQLYKGILAKYGHNVSGGVGVFSEFGFLDATFFVDALKSMKGKPYTLKNVNQAIVHLKNVPNALECEPFNYGPMPLHIPDNDNPIVTPENGKMVTVPGAACVKISSADPQIAQYRKAAAAAGVDP
jgi:branched-chain amino acid transport system substrate-binding protein